MDARELAMLTLSACEHQGAWSDGQLKKSIRDEKLDARDAALATRLCYGVLQNRLLLDFYIDSFSTVKTTRMETKVLNALRIGVYQLVFLTKIPASAAVNEAVMLTNTYCKSPKAAGLVNAVLRTIDRHSGKLPIPVGDDEAAVLSVQYSHPQWLVQEFLRTFGREGAEELLKADNEISPIVAQVNTVKTTTDQVEASLQESGARVERHPFLPDCLLFSAAGDLEHQAAFRSGGLYIQDAAARMAVMAADLQPGNRVMDACAAPGGKSFAAAIAMKNTGTVVSCDIHPHKVELLERGAERLGLSCIIPLLLDGKTNREEWQGGFDAVLADVPCSGLGIIRKKPDIRYKDPKPLENLPGVQLAILENVSTYVKPGGTLLYSTCTILERENRGVVTAFLKKHREFTAEPFALPAPIEPATDGMITLLPHLHGTDGFFVAKLRRAL
ncbi:MAG: 16S rRNA (cytosine(967)-C(5))-methyltransferase RsmB [Oscillospiraceae bacterium]